VPAGNALSGIAGDLWRIDSGALFVASWRSQTSKTALSAIQPAPVYWVSKIEDARERLAQHTSVSEDRKSGIITIGFTDHDRSAPRPSLAPM